MSHHLPPPVIYTADIGALFAILASVLGYLGPIAAFIASTLAATVYGFQLYDRYRKK